MCAQTVNRKSSQLSMSLDTTWNNLSFWKTKTWSKIRGLIAAHQEDVTPPINMIFRPFVETPLKSVRVMFILPEPYHTPGQATGLALAHGRDDGRSPILFDQVIDCVRESYKETKAKRSDLRQWAKRGVLLWNSRLTTLKGHSAGHLGLGWEELTKEVIDTVYLMNPKTVFVFYGDEMYNQYRSRLPEDSHCILMPKVEIGRENLRGTKIFGKINQILKAERKQRINWET